MKIGGGGGMLERGGGEEEGKTEFSHGGFPNDYIPFICIRMVSENANCFLAPTQFQP